MSRFLTVENLLSTFPEPMAGNEMLSALAFVTAQELLKLCESNDFLALYARIDELDESLLDILAYDFKIDWWDKNYSLEEKRQLFRNSWNVHRRMGTPLACSLAISSIYQSAALKEWWEYGGNPFHFKIQIDTGSVLTDCEKLQRVADGVQYYKNKRSVLERIEVNAGKTTQMYIGCALHTANKVQLVVESKNLDDYVYYTDENDNILTDENGLLLFI